MSQEINNNLDSFLSIIQEDKEAKNLYSVRAFLVELGYKQSYVSSRWDKLKEGILQKCLDIASLSNIDLQKHYYPLVEKSGGGRDKGDYLFSARLLAFLAMEADSKFPRVIEYRNLFATLFENKIEEAQEKKRRGRKPKKEQLTDYERLVVLERKEEKDSTKGLRKTAVNHGMRDYSTFWNAGYEMFGEGETASSIKSHFKLKDNDNLHDYDNTLIRSMTKAKNEVAKKKIEKERIHGNNKCIQAHSDVANTFYKAMAYEGVYLKDEQLGENIKPWENAYKREQKLLVSQN